MTTNGTTPNGIAWEVKEYNREDRVRLCKLKTGWAVLYSFGLVCSWNGAEWVYNPHPIPTFPFDEAWTIFQSVKTP